MVRGAGRDRHGAAYYGSIAEGYDRLHREEQLRKLAIIGQFIPKSALVLDVGCGAGYSVPEPFIPFGIEISKALALAGADTVILDINKKAGKRLDWYRTF